MCVNWNALQYLACTTVELQPVATRLPGVRLPLEDQIINCEEQYPDSKLNWGSQLTKSPDESSSYTCHWPVVHFLSMLLLFVP